SAAAPVQPLLNAFPKPNGADLGNGTAMFSAGYSDPSSLDSYSGRIDYVLSQKVTLFGRYSEAPSSTDQRAEALFRTITTRFYTQIIGCAVPRSAVVRFLRLG